MTKLSHLGVPMSGKGFLLPHRQYLESELMHRVRCMYIKAGLQEKADKLKAKLDEFERALYNEGLLTRETVDDAIDEINHDNRI